MSEFPYMGDCLHCGVMVRWSVRLGAYESLSTEQTTCTPSGSVRHDVRGGR